MTERETCLLSYLTQKNPVLDISNGRPGRNTRTTKGSWKLPCRIDYWEEFRYESLESTCEGRLMNLLNSTMSLEIVKISPIPWCKITDEEALTTLLVKWTHTIVSNALKAAQTTPIAATTSEEVRMYRGGQAESLLEYPKGDAKRRRSNPDWAAVKLRTAEADTTRLNPVSSGDNAPTTALSNGRKVPSKPVNILPGDTKVSWKWKSKDVQMGDRQDFREAPNSLQPVLQVFNYCLKANARYGYIITDKELVVLRVRADTAVAEQTSAQNIQSEPDSQEQYASMEQKKARRRGVVELMSIPWDHHADDTISTKRGLTVNLALWWLHIMAFLQSHIGSEYVCLSEEKLPETREQDNLSFTEAVAEVELTCSASFNSHDGNTARTKRKRKLDRSQSEVESSKRSRSRTIDWMTK